MVPGDKLRSLKVKTSAWGEKWSNKRICIQIPTAHIHLLRPSESAAIFPAEAVMLLKAAQEMGREEVGWGLGVGDESSITDEGGEEEKEG